MSNNLKIVIPTAGWATRVRPQTWSKPKPLVGVAGRTTLDHLLDSFNSVPNPETAEYVIILGPYLGETQIPPYMKEHYPGYKVHYVLQSVMRGQSDALWLAREYLAGPMIMCFSDTLIETDFSFLANEIADGVAWVKSIPDPRRFGVVEMDADGWATRLIEKPASIVNNRVLVGCYYFREGRQLVSAIEEQIKRRKSLKGEYFLVDAINIMIERGLKMRTQAVDIWLDMGTIETILETNRYLLDHGRDNTKNINRKNVRIVPPVFIHESAKVTNSTIGPHASIGADCRIINSRVEDSILEAGVLVDTAALKGSFVGRRARIQGHSADSTPMVLNIGDDSSVVLK
ncbi:MAG: sugar phosphate nucleotidyltransferase [Anaerolineales bacterium]|jgi:glucose-1-phosphate thymidylyltransferase